MPLSYEERVEILKRAREVKKQKAEAKKVIETQQVEEPVKEPVKKTRKKKDKFLLDLAAKITINQMKGVSNNFSDEEIEILKQKHKEAAAAGVIETPPDLFYEALHPLSKPAEEYYEEYNKEPVENIALE